MKGSAVESLVSNLLRQKKQVHHSLDLTILTEKTPTSQVVADVNKTFFHRFELKS